MVYMDIRIRRLQPLQFIAIGVAITHLSLLLFYILLYSQPRKGLGSSSEVSEDSFDDVNGTAQVVMELFNRTEFKEGTRKWTINAKTARYVSKENIIFLEQPQVTIFRENNEQPTIVNSKSARLLLTEGVVKSAFLEGDVKIQLSSDLSLLTSVAEYREVDARLITPERVYIVGPGYQVAGNRMDLEVEKAFVTLSEDVESEFKPGKNKPKFRNLKSIKSK